MQHKRTNTHTIEERNEWRSWVTPKALVRKPIHRWYVFPHSFTSELVHELIHDWGLTEKDKILDPFAGAGTTLLAAKEKNVPATGYDLSPFAVFIASVKTRDYKVARLIDLWCTLRSAIDPVHWNGTAKDYPNLVSRALPGKLLGAFDAIDRDIANLDATKSERDFFRLALLSTLRQYSRAVAQGGWLRWVNRRNRSTSILRRFSEHVELMLADLNDGASLQETSSWTANLNDARSLPDAEETYTAVITSPPYPNRHDYTRIFGVELMFGFLNWEKTRQLRHQSFHSHPEARPNRPSVPGYVCPPRLAQAIAQLRRKEHDGRVCRMLEGYFLDLYLVLRESQRVCRKNAQMALVVGNAQYGGVPIVVDELTAEIGEQAGLNCEKLIATRYRGNSAQQMGEYGRNPSRESIVLFSKP